MGTLSLSYVSLLNVRLLQMLDLIHLPLKRNAASQGLHDVCAGVSLRPGRVGRSRQNHTTSYPYTGQVKSACLRNMLASGETRPLSDMRGMTSDSFCD